MGTVPSTIFAWAPKTSGALPWWAPYPVLNNDGHLDPAQPAKFCPSPWDTGQWVRQQPGPNKKSTLSDSTHQSWCIKRAPVNTVKTKESVKQTQSFLRTETWTQNITQTLQIQATCSKLSPEGIHPPSPEPCSVTTQAQNWNYLILNKHFNNLFIPNIKETPQNLKA